MAGKYGVFLCAIGLLLLAGCIPAPAGVPAPTALRALPGTGADPVYRRAERIGSRLCLASWYGEEHRGMLMANGRPFDPDRLTAASWSIPLGTRVRVSHAGRSVLVEITDRGPAWRLVRQGRKIDLSAAAFRRLARPGRGLIEVEIAPP